MSALTDTRGASNGLIPATVSRRRRRLAMLLTFVLVGGLGFGVLELAFRLFVDVTDALTYFWDPVIGPRLAPNQTGRIVSGAYINARYHVNAQGWNHPDDYVVARPRSTRRICLVGDSQVESRQVDVDQTMYMVARRGMSGPDRPVQWYAFGNAGWGTTVEYEVIRRYALDYHPDLVILLFVQNDPFDCSPYIVAPTAYRVSYFLDEDNQLALVLPASDWRYSWKWRLFNHSALVRYFAVQKRLWFRLRGETQGRRMGGLPLMAEGSAPRLNSPPGLAQMSMPQRYEKTWELTEKLLAACRDECNHRGAVFAIAFRGWPPDIDAPLAGPGPMVPPKEVDPYCLNERISEMGREIVGPIAQRLDIPYLDLTEALRAMVAQTQQSHEFPDDMHYSVAGHKAAGEALAAWAESLLPRAASQPSLPTTFPSVLFEADGRSSAASHLRRPANSVR